MKLPFPVDFKEVENINRAVDIIYESRQNALNLNSERNEVESDFDEIAGSVSASDEGKESHLYYLLLQNHQISKILV